MFFVYINLKERSAKSVYISNLLKSLNLKYERFDAIRPTHSQALQVDKITPRIKQYLHNEIQIPRALGVIGCYLSHLNVLEKYRNINSKYLCVLEDDVKFDDSSLKLVNETIDFLNNQNIDWDILRSVWNNTFKSLKKKEEIITISKSNIYKFNSPNWQGISSTNRLNNEFCGGTHFQIINIKNIEKIINYLNRENIYNIDSIYSTNEINIYAVEDKYLNICRHPKYKNHSDIPKV